MSKKERFVNKFVTMAKYFSIFGFGLGVACSIEYKLDLCTISIMALSLFLLYCTTTKLNEDAEDLYYEGV